MIARVHITLVGALVRPALAAGNVERAEALRDALRIVGKAMAGEGVGP